MMTSMTDGEALTVLPPVGQTLTDARAATPTLIEEETSLFSILEDEIASEMTAEGSIDGHQMIGGQLAR